MKRDIEDAATRLRGIEGPTFYTVNGEKARQINEREYVDAITLAMAFLAEHPVDEDDAADSTFLEEAGFGWDDQDFMSKHLGGGWELLCPLEGNSRRDDYMCAKSLTLRFTNNVPQLTCNFGLTDNPTRRFVRLLLTIFKGECP